VHPRCDSSKKLEAKHPKAEKIHVILDNASCYISKWLKEKLKGGEDCLALFAGLFAEFELD